MLIRDVILNIQNYGTILSLSLLTRLSLSQLADFRQLFYVNFMSNNTILVAKFYYNNASS